MTIVLVEASSASEPVEFGATADESATPFDIVSKDIAPEFVGAAILCEPDGGGNTADFNGPIILRGPVSGLVVGALERGFLLGRPVAPCKHGGSCSGVDLGFRAITAFCVRDEALPVGLVSSLS